MASLGTYTFKAPGGPEQLHRSLSRSLSRTDNRKHFTDSNLGSAMLKGLFRLKCEGSFTDVNIIAEDQTFSVHRVVLAATSPYFSAMFSPNMKEGSKDTITLPNMMAGVVAKLIDFMYTGELDIDGENVQDLLIGANFFNIVSVEEACSDFIHNNTDFSNALEIIQFAEYQGVSRLYKDTIEYLAINFTQFEDNGFSFNELSLDTFSNVIKHEELCIMVSGILQHPSVQEKKLSEVIIKYVNHEPESRMSHLPTLIEYVKLPMMDVPSLVSLREELAKMTGYDADHPFLRSIERSERLSADGKGFLCKDFSTTPRKRTAVEVMVGPSYAGGGQVRPEVLAFEAFVNEWTWISGLKIWIRRWDGRPVLGGLEIFFSSGESQLYGTTEDADFHEFYLDKTEKITGARVTSGWMIDKLVFTTSRGRTLGPFGGSGGGERTPEPSGVDNAYLCGISGTVVESQGQEGITHLRFKWAYVPSTRPVKEEWY